MQRLQQITLAYRNAAATHLAAVAELVFFDQLQHFPVKIGYLVPELYNMRGDWIMALTPGGVDQDLERLGYHRIKRPMFPLDKDMDDPDLTARLVPSSDIDAKK